MSTHKKAQVGGAVGGTAFAIAGGAIGGPVGALVGSILGQLLGSSIASGGREFGFQFGMNGDSEGFYPKPTVEENVVPLWSQLAWETVCSFGGSDDPSGDRSNTDQRLKSGTIIAVNGMVVLSEGGASISGGNRAFLTVGQQ